MDIKEIRKRIKKWRDFYGQDIVDTTNITTKDKAREVLEEHRRFLEDQNTDALEHLNNFERELGLY